MRIGSSVTGAALERLFLSLSIPVKAFLQKHTGLVLTGGAVRDILLGRPTGDVDFTVERGEPVRIGRAFANMAGGALVLLGDKRLVRVHVGRLTFDFTPLRAPTLEKDLSKRDFTINAMGIRLPWSNENVIVDPLNGLADLRRGLLRMCSPRIFSEDPIRLWRAVRLPLDLAFRLETRTKATMVAEAARIRTFPAERLRDEFFKLLDHPEAGKGLAVAARNGLLLPAFPQMRPMVCVTLRGKRGIKVLDHTLEALLHLDRVLKAASKKHRAEASAFCSHLASQPVKGRSRRSLLRLSLLFHDIAKPETASVAKDGRVHFFEHERIGAEKAAGIMRAKLRCAESEIAIVRRTILNHLRIGYLSGAGKVSDRAIFRFLRDAGGELHEIVLHGEADRLATHFRGSIAGRSQTSVVKRIWDFRRRAGERQCLKKLVDGNDLMRALKLAEGPLIGELLRHVEEEVALGRVKSREEALNCALKGLDRARKKVLN